MTTTNNVYSGAILQTTVVNRPLGANYYVNSNGCSIAVSDSFGYKTYIKNGDTQSACSYTTENGCIVGPIDSGSCYYNGTLEDWRFDDIACPLYIGGYTPQCSTVDDNRCILYVDGVERVGANFVTYSTPCNDVRTPCTTGGPVAGQPLTTTWFSKDEVTNKLSQGRNIRCDYNADLFTNDVGIIKSYYNKFANSSNMNNVSDKVKSFNEGNYNVMMQDFSSSASTDVDATCPKYILYPYVDVTPETCSRFIASGEQGDWTREWEGGTQVGQSVVPYSDNSKVKYCVDNPNAPECACINRSTVDKNYNDLQAIVTLPAQCWYSPCQSDQYLRTSDIADLSVCPSNVCQLINQNVADSGGVITSEQQQNMSCEVTNNTGDVSGGGSGSGGGGDSSSGGGSSSSGGGIPTWLWIVLLAGGGLLIVIIIVIFIASRKKKPVE